jgi:peptide/nickel transport system substrate-binding protein
MKRRVSTAILAAVAAVGVSWPAWAGDVIRTLTILSRPQASQPQEFQSIQLLAQEWRKLGLDIRVQVMPWEQMSDLVWYQRDKWDMTAWQMVGRPERLDPDELVFNLFHTSTSEKGYNFVGYKNPTYDEIATAQRAETDIEKRRALVFKAQEMIAADQPIINLVHPKVSYAFNKSVWKEGSVVEQAGIGIRNFWTSIGLEPVGDKKDIVLNSADNINAINPLYISGGPDSWIYELIWDRLLRVGPNGLPQPWAAESYNWVNDKTIDVTMRPDLKWHDGSPVTLDDVIFSFQAPAGDEAPMYKPFVSNIASIEKTGERTVRFQLKQPAAGFLIATLAKINLIPKKVWESKIAELGAKPENAESYQEPLPMGSGPFKFSRWLKSEEIVLEANPAHFSPPKASRWIMRIVPNTEAALGMLKSGEINFLSDYNGDVNVLEQLVAAQPQLKLVTTTELGFRYVAVNMRRPPFDDLAFRRALSTAFDRRLIVGAAYKGAAVPGVTMISPAVEAWYNPASAKTEPGLEKAKAMLKEAGYTLQGGKLAYPDGKTETIKN